MNIGKSLKIALTKSGLTQLEVAEDLDMHPVLLNRHFNSELIGAKAICKYADYFDIKPSELIALSE